MAVLRISTWPTGGIEDTKGAARGPQAEGSLMLADTRPLHVHGCISVLVQACAHGLGRSLVSKLHGQLAGYKQTSNFPRRNCFISRQNAIVQTSMSVVLKGFMG